MALKKIITYYKKAKDWFWALPLWKRTILTSLIGAVGGSSVISFANKYALYYYAYNNGFRIPVEGVEYLDLAIALVSFLLILFTSIGTIIFYNLLKIIAIIISKIFTKNAQLIKKYENRIVTFFVLSIILLLILKFYFEGFDNVIKKMKEDSDPTLLIIGFFTGIYSSILIKFSKKAKSRKLFTLYTITGGVCILIILMFNQSIYGTFLKTIGYGGEIPIQVEYRKADNTESVVNGLLMIRTNKSISIKNELTQDIAEIPTIRISKIVFKSN